MSELVKLTTPVTSVSLIADARAAGVPEYLVHNVAKLVAAGIFEGARQVALAAAEKGGDK